MNESWYWLYSRSMRQPILEDHIIEDGVFRFTGAVLVFYDREDAERAAIGKRIEFPLCDINVEPMPVAPPALKASVPPPGPANLVGIQTVVSVAGIRDLSIDVELRNFGNRPSDAFFVESVAELICKTIDAQEKLRRGPLCLIRTGVMAPKPSDTPSDDTQEKAA